MKVLFCFEEKSHFMDFSNVVRHDLTFRLVPFKFQYFRGLLLVQFEFQDKSAHKHLAKLQKSRQRPITNSVLPNFYIKL